MKNENDINMPLFKEVYGPIMKYLNDPKVTDIDCNPDGVPHVTRFGEESEEVDMIIPVEKRLSMISFAAGAMDLYIGPDKPDVDTILPVYKYRFHGTIRPWVSSPAFSIRKPGPIIELRKYVEEKRMTKEEMEYIITAIKERKNILVSGGTGSGKTTLLKSILSAIQDIMPKDRLFIQEDTPEIELKINNYLKYWITDRKDFRRGVEAGLRSNISRVIYGELRTSEVTDALLEAWNTGHPGGLATVHADSPKSTIKRIVHLLSKEYKGSVDLEFVAEAIDVIINIKKKPGFGPRLSGIIEVEDELVDGEVKFKKIF